MAYLIVCAVAGLLCPIWYLVGWNEHKRHLQKLHTKKLQTNAKYGVMGHDVKGHTIVEWWLAGQDDAKEKESGDD